MNAVSDACWCIKNIAVIGLKPKDCTDKKIHFILEKKKLEPRRLF